MTKREAEVSELISFGKMNVEIAKVLNLSVNTISGYVGNIFSKLDVSDWVSAAVKAQTIKVKI